MNNFLGRRYGQAKFQDHALNPHLWTPDASDRDS